ncbi:M15 family metallopeptidase [Lacrimispora saccharolytica]|uniref:Serine-type D-Ala-D-Ala carboxypeptidase n=1 Tax=Lacrimispora saccharolytica (strain ATCC 35040 / DSM 2544 / NRCC 2533 / WM1) TaxID=610130 RepID=D9R853_LACSW|nr:Serine-type D-Ala-D-Ala carboxypeptidase [[Clostridium] saccharolyticum WM1]QRV21878.1 M15 family metallopeptidase [Lacrimispora saccharolytica]
MVNCNNNYSGYKRKRALKQHSRLRKNHMILRLISVAAVIGLLWYCINGLNLKEVSPEPILSIGTDSPDISSADIKKDDTDDPLWSLILVNRWNVIPEDYHVDLTKLSNGQTVDTRIYPALQNMFDAARADGVNLVVVSGYRTAEKQQSLMDEKVAAYKAEGYSAYQAKTEAETWVAIPGTSEHQLGIAVDINADGVQSKGSEVYKWLKQNGYRFGFILRYPPDKTEITGVSNEPWHYRYVGIKAATEMNDQNLCLEEYLRDKN